MAPYRNRLVVIDAVQFHVYELPWPDGVKRADLQHNLPRDPDYWPTGSPIIDTPQGTLLVHDKDWILTRSTGEKFLCRPTIFDALWEPYNPSPIILPN